MDTLEGNKLITEIDGWVLFPAYPFEGTTTICIPEHYERGQDWHSLEKITYHSSWDSLMPVVEKIEDIGYMVVIKRTSKRTGFCQIIAMDSQFRGIAQYHASKITAVWLAVVDFIQWYNTQPKKL